MTQFVPTLGSCFWQNVEFIAKFQFYQKRWLLFSSMYSVILNTMSFFLTFRTTCTMVHMYVIFIRKLNWAIFRAWDTCYIVLEHTWKPPLAVIWNYFHIFWGDFRGYVVFFYMKHLSELRNRLNKRNKHSVICIGCQLLINKHGSIN